MTKEYYDYSQLMNRIIDRFEDIHTFCGVAEFAPVEFLTDIGDGNLSVEEIRKCVDVLQIPHDEIGFYFFRTDDSRRAPGRPKKDIEKTTTPPRNNRYYTIAEFVQLSGIHRHTLQSRLREGKLKGKLIGRTWRIYRDELFDNSSYLYFFDCNDATFGEKYLTPIELDVMENHSDEPHPLTEGQIISIARNLEATLYRCNSDKSKEVCIYDCMDL